MLLLLYLNMQEVRLYINYIFIYKYYYLIVFKYIILGFASELLCDAKDYADHAERLDIVVEDVKLAVKLSDMRVTGVDPRIQIVNKVASQINSKDLIELLNKDDVSIRYPKSLQDSLLERTYTFVPGSVAYPEVSNITFIYSNYKFYVNFINKNRKISII